MSQEIIGTCEEENCKVLANGKCVNGFENLEECPHFSKNKKAVELSPIDIEKNSAVENDFVDEKIDLYSGNALTYDDAYKITRSSLTKVIVIIGAHESGKTTLLTCLNQLFQKGSFSNYIFGGSYTLLGFEERCFPSRIVSKGKFQDTERTKFSPDIHLLHLSVRDVELKKSTRHLLFTDISGEDYFNSLKDSTEACLDCKILKRADHFVLLIDCEKLIDSPALRNQTKFDNMTLLRSCIDAGMIGMNSIISILFSKWDHIDSLKKEEKENSEEFIFGVKENIKALTKSKIGELEFFNIAARPSKNKKLKDGYGLDKVFPNWVEKTLLYRRKRTNVVAKKLYDREFSNYSWKFSL